MSVRSKFATGAAAAVLGGGILALPAIGLFSGDHASTPLPVRSAAPEQPFVPADPTPEFVGSVANVATTIGADALYDAGIDGAGVGVAIIDSGISPVDGLSAPGKVVHGPDFTVEATTADAGLDTYGHGTHLGGIIAGQASDGFAGIAPGAHLVSLKVADRDGTTDPQNVISAIEWVIDHRAEHNIRVLELAFNVESLVPASQDPLAQAVEAAWNAGIFVSVAAGNEGTAANPALSPAYAPTVFTVGASDSNSTVSVTDDVLADFSSHRADRQPDLVAPGRTVVSLLSPGSTIGEEAPASSIIDGRFLKGSGTSEASAVAAGAAALLFDADPSLTPDAIRQLMTSSATPLAQSDGAAGAGVLNLGGAVSLLGSLNGSSWNGSSWNGSSWNGSSWNGSSWNGSSWNGSSWNGSSWNGSSWNGSSWNGSSWNGSSWNGSSWNGSSWNGSSWNGSSWNGSSWNGSSWNGSSWNGSSWNGSSWNGSSWNGSSWNGSSWNGSSWNGSSWNGSSWNGSSWNGSSWNGSSWNGSSWNGSSWNGSSWNGSSWNGSSWNGSSWNGSSWN